MPNNQLKNTKIMKITKLSLLALSFGLFAASCGGDATEEGTDTDTTVVAPMTEPAPMTTPDTMMAAPATTDTMMMNSGSSMDTMKK